MEQVPNDVEQAVLDELDKLTDRPTQRSPSWKLSDLTKGVREMLSMLAGCDLMGCSPEQVAKAILGQIRNPAGVWNDEDTEATRIAWLRGYIIAADHYENFMEDAISDMVEQRSKNS